MATTAILSQDGVAGDAASVERWITRETEQLAAHLFATTYKMDWRAAWNQAIAELPELLTYAAAWDADAETPFVGGDVPAITAGSRWVIYRAGQPYEVEVLDIDGDHQDALCEGSGLYGWLPLAELTEPSPYALEAAHAAA